MRRILSGPTAALLILSVLALAPAPAQDTSAPPLYDELRAVELEHRGTLRNVVFRRDRVELHIEDAQLYVTTATGGIRTGAVILGDGRLVVEPPTGVERQQFEKYLDESTLDEEFEKAVLRFTDDGADELISMATAGGRAKLNDARKQYRERHKKLGEDQLVNLDSRVLLDLLDPVDTGFFAADIDAKGWVTVLLDPREREEIRLSKSHGGERQPDTWGVMHLEEQHSTATGRQSARLGPLRPAETWQPTFDVPDVHVDMLLDDDDDVEALATLRLQARIPSRATTLSISPVLEITEITWSADDGAWPPPADSASSDEVPLAPGAPLEFVQEHLPRGSREDFYDRRVVVTLPDSMTQGDTIRLHVRYQGELIDKGFDRQYRVRDQSGWFPWHPDARRSRFSTTFRTPDQHRVASGGAVTADDEIEGKRITRRTNDVATIGMSFHYGRLETSEHETVDGPTFTVYASEDSTAFNPGRRDDTIRDLRKALDLFSDYFGPAPFKQLVIAESPATDAWAFHGFLLMPYTTFAGMHTGEAEMFRSHELAHQWWGNSVTWDSYHDVWLSEGFASYCAALYAQRALDDEDQFVDMLDAWNKDILRGGDVAQRVGTRNYGFPPEALRKSQGTESGPIWIGERLSSDKTPPDYRVLVYEKGAFVLHMLRMMRYDWETGDDSDFQELMRRFQADHAGGVASTEDFLDAVEAIYDEDMLWFFDQWVYGTEVPEYRPDLEVRQVGGEWRLQGSIEQRDTSHDFRMPLPVRVEFRDGTSQVVIVEVSGTGVDVDVPVRGRAEDIEVNPLHAVLANMR